MSNAALRRALHAATAAVAVLAILSPAALRLGTGSLAVSMLVLETVRLRSTLVADTLARVLPVYRDSERRRPSGALWLMVGYAACAWFPYPAAVAGILAGGLADPAGAVVGSRFGRGAPKSGAGSAAVAGATTLMGLALGIPWLTALIAGAAAAAVERSSGPIDDNLLVGPATAAVVLALA